MKISSKISFRFLFHFTLIFIHNKFFSISSFFLGLFCSFSFLINCCPFFSSLFRARHSLKATVSVSLSNPNHSNKFFFFLLLFTILSFVSYHLKSRPFVCLRQFFFIFSNSLAFPPNAGWTSHNVVFSLRLMFLRKTQHMAHIQFHFSFWPSLSVLVHCPCVWNVTV